MQRQLCMKQRWWWGGQEILEAHPVDAYQASDNPFSQCCMFGPLVYSLRKSHTHTHTHKTKSKPSKSHCDDQPKCALFPQIALTCA